MKRFNLETEELLGQRWEKGTIIFLGMLKGLEENWAIVEIIVEGRGK